MKPLSNFVFVEFPKKESKGITVSDVNKKPIIADVIEVGDGKIDKHGNFIKMTVKKGDKVIIDPYIVRAIKEGKQEYFIIREDEIFAIL